MAQFETCKDNPMYSYLVMLVVASAFGFQGWQILFNNFAVDTIGLNGVHVGAIQSVKEIPGLLTFSAVFILLVIAEHRLAALAAILLGMGDILTGLIPSFGGLLLTTLVLSTGFHYFETCNQSLTLQYFAGPRVITVLARLKSYTALSNIIVGVFYGWFPDICLFPRSLASSDLLCYSQAFIPLLKNQWTKPCPLSIKNWFCAKDTGCFICSIS